MADDPAAQILDLAGALPSRPHRSSWVIDVAEITTKDGDTALLAQMTFVNEFGFVGKYWFSPRELTEFGVAALEHSKEMTQAKKESGLIVTKAMPPGDIKGVK